MIIKTKYDIGQIVYLITDKEQDGRLIVEIKIAGSDILYSVACGSVFTNHYAIELSSDKDIKFM